MSLVYLILLALVGTLAWLTGVRSKRLEFKHNLVNDLVQSKQKGIDRHNPFASLALAMDTLKLEGQRQRLESSYIRWSDWHDWFQSVTKRLLAFRGKMTPYVLGVFDSLTVVALLQSHRLIEITDWAQVVERTVALLTGQFS